MHQHFAALNKTPANYVPLTPLSFLARAAHVYRDLPAVVYGKHQQTWAEFSLHCHQLAGALAVRGLGLGDVVSVLSPNIPQVFALHYAVPMTGGVLNTINMRLEAETIAYILDHADTKLLFVDSAFARVARAAFAIMGREIAVIEINDIGEPQFDEEYDDFIKLGDANFAPVLPADEWQAITLSYTSGTSGRPKGVVYHHRGAYLMAMGTVPAWGIAQGAQYLSVVPMFHCNGWNHPWVIAVVGGTMHFIRDVDPALIFKTISEQAITHLGAAPIVLSMLSDSPAAPKTPLDPVIKVMTAGAPPPPAILQKTRAMGMDVMQVYGLTETQGHISQSLWRTEWDDLTPPAQSEHQAMQGVAFPMVENFTAINRETGASVPHDGETQGEIAIRGNTVMMGYYKDADATAEAFANGYFWSGDAGVIHDDGYMQLRDRLKDVIISGGENISSVEVENIAYRHPAIAAAGVVAMPSEKWGESPCLFAELREGATATEAELIAFLKSNLAGFKVPKKVVFDNELPKTATGKIQKFILRERAKTLGDI